MSAEHDASEPIQSPSGNLVAARAIEQLRLICVELGMAPIRDQRNRRNR